MTSNQTTCCICGKLATLRLPYRSVFPRSPACEACAGPAPSPRTYDAWGELHPYPIDAKLPMQLERNQYLEYARVQSNNLRRWGN